MSVVVEERGGDRSKEVSNLEAGMMLRRRASEKEQERATENKREREEDSEEEKEAKLWGKV